MPNQKFRTVSPMTIDGKARSPGFEFTADLLDPTVRSWLKAGNVKAVPKKKSASKEDD